MPQTKRGPPQPQPPDRLSVSFEQSEIEIEQSENPTTESPEEPRCCVCLEPLESESAPPTATLPCQHVLHTACLSRWMRTGDSNKCPLCNAGVYEGGSDEEESSEADSDLEAIENVTRMVIEGGGLGLGPQGPVEVTMRFDVSTAALVWAVAAVFVAAAAGAIWSHVLMRPSPTIIRY